MVMSIGFLHKNFIIFWSFPQLYMKLLVDLRSGFWLSTLILVGSRQVQKTKAGRSCAGITVSCSLRSLSFLCLVRRIAKLRQLAKGPNTGRPKAVVVRELFRKVGRKCRFCCKKYNSRYLIVKQG